MNIFATSISPLISAITLDDVRARKMILENAQMLSTCVHHYARYIKNYNSSYFYKPNHQRHPCTLWVQHSLANTCWLILHSHYLHEIHKFNSNKLHKSYDIIEIIQDFLDESTSSLPEAFVEGNFSPFPNCTPFKNPLDKRDVYTRYQHYMIQKWETDKIVVQWSNRPVPQFYVDFLNKKGRKL